MKEYFQKTVFSDGTSILGGTTAKFTLTSLYINKIEPIICDYSINFSNTGNIEIHNYLYTNQIKCAIHRIGLEFTVSSSNYKIINSNKSDSVAKYIFKNNTLSFISPNPKISWDLIFNCKTSKIIISNKNLPIYDLKFYGVIKNKKTEILDLIDNTGPKFSLIKMPKYITDNNVLAILKIGCNKHMVKTSPITPCNKCNDLENNP